MADIFQWYGEGLAPGDLTTSSAGTGDTAPSQINNTTPTIVDSGTHTPRIQFAASGNAQWDFTGTAQGGGRTKFVSPTGTPSVSTIIVQVNDGATKAYQIDYSGTRRFNLRDNAGVIDQTDANFVTDATEYRLEWRADHSTGAVQVAIFAGDNTTPLDTLIGSGRSIGTQQSRIYFGIIGPYGFGSSPVYMDDILVTDTNAFPGPIPATVGSTIRPDSTVSNTDSWTAEGGAASIDAALSDEDDDTFARTPATPDNTAIVVGCSVELDTGDATVAVRARYNGDPGTVKIELLDSSSTVIAAGTAQAVTSAWDTYYLVLNGTQNAAIADSADRTGLRVRITGDES